MDYSQILNNLQQRPPRNLNDHMLIVDGNNMMIRNFALIKVLNNDGHHVGGVVGFLRSLAFSIRTIDPTRVLVVFDGKGGSNNRKNIDSNYKANRHHTRITNWGVYDSKAEEIEALSGQFDRLYDYLECLPVHTICLEKLEADDIIATVAKEYSRRNKRVTIVSSDKDFLQLISSSIEVYSSIKKVTYTVDNIVEFLGVLPENYSIVKALLGDQSDNLQGIKGLGIKTLVKEIPELVSQPLTLENIYSICEQRLGKKKIYANIIYGWDKVETNNTLMNLHKDLLDEKELNTVLEILRSPIPPLQSGIFLHLMDQDKIESITKNSDAWLETFRFLTLF